MDSATELLVPVAGGRVAVIERAGSGTPLLLVHGAGHNAGIWTEVLPRLSPRRAVAVDLRGHGQTVMPENFSTTVLAQDLASIVDNLGLRRPIVVGHSWGANITVEAAAAGLIDCTGIVLVEGNVGSYTEVYADTEWSAPDDIVAEPPTTLSSDEIEALAVATDSVQAALLRRSWRDFTLHPTPSERAARAREAWRQPLTDLFDNVECPTLMIRAENGLGEGDPLAAAAIARHLELLTHRHPEFRVQWMPCGHAVPYFLPKELAEIISDYADELETGRHST